MRVRTGFHFGIVSIALALATTTIAQDEDRLRIKQADFDQHGQSLELSMSQQEAAEQAFREYAREYDYAREAFRLLNRWGYSNGSDWCGGHDIEDFSRRLERENWALDEAWQRGARELELKYFNGLRRCAIGKKDAVETLRRQHLRARLLRDDCLVSPKGAATDLIALVADMDASITFNPAVSEILHEYEIRLDEELRKYDQYTIVRSARLDLAAYALQEAKRDGLPIEALAEHFADEMVQTGRHALAIWSLHEITAKRIIAALPDTQRPDFEDAVHASLHAYLMTEKQPAPERVFADALARTNINAEQRQQLEQLRTEYRSLRSAALPELHRLHMQTCDPDLDREWHILYRSGRKEEGLHRLNAINQAWDDAQEQWCAKCQKTVASIRTVTGEQAAEAQP